MKTQRKKVAKEDQSPTSHLPNHVMIEILSRLPLKTLIAIKCVSKSWHNLVSRDTHLAKLHHLRSQPEILLRSYTSHRGSGNLQLATLQFENNAFPSPKLNLLIDLPEFSVRVDYTIDLKSQFRQLSSLSLVNSCNGLVCFRNIPRIHGNLSYAVICNPVTGEFITVPPPRAIAQQDRSYYGMGFSRKENRYKLLMVSGSPRDKPLAEICTFEKGSLWRNLGDCSLMMHKDLLGNPPYVFLEGKLHFNTDGGCIYCFDFEDEQFGKVPLPPRNGWGNCIGVLRGCLSVSRFGIDRTTVGIWMMEEYGVEGSWIKALSVVNCCFCYLPVPVMYWGNGEILMSYAGFIALCSSVRCLIISIGSGNVCEQGIVYTPTLLRLKNALAGYGARVWNRNSKSVEIGELGGHAVII